jgi:hypothetical protein
LILGSNPDLPDGVLRPRIDQVFPTDEVAYLDLYNYWIRIKQDGYYPGNYEMLMKRLIDKLKVQILSTLSSLNPNDRSILVSGRGSLKREIEIVQLGK